MLQIMEQNKQRADENIKKNKTHPTQYKINLRSGERGEGLQNIRIKFYSFFGKGF